MGLKSPYFGQHYLVLAPSTKTMSVLVRKMAFTERYFYRILRFPAFAYMGACSFKKLLAIFVQLNYFVCRCQYFTTILKFAQIVLILVRLTCNQPITVSLYYNAIFSSLTNKRRLKDNIKFVKHFN